MPVIALISAQVSISNPEFLPYTLLMLCDCSSAEVDLSKAFAPSCDCFVGVEFNEEQERCVPRVGVLIVELSYKD